MDQDITETKYQKYVLYVKDTYHYFVNPANYYQKLFCLRITHSDKKISKYFFFGSGTVPEIQNVYFY